MDVRWPGFLLVLGLLPLVIAVYLWVMRRRRRFAVRYSSLALVREALPQASLLRRHLPFALFVLALASLVICLGRPVAVVSVHAGRATIILAMDVSRSMCSTDILPNRLEAAKDAALAFIQDQRSSTQIGIVAFAGFAELIVPPTADQEVLEDAMESLTTGRRTAIGSAILRSLDAIAEVDENVAPSVSVGSSGISPTPVAKGAYVSDIIVLLTDGASHAGPEPVEAAQQAVDRGVRVYTIGFGTVEGGRMECGDWVQGGNFGGAGFFGGGGFRRGIDEATLMEVADRTGGTYYSAESAGQLQQVFRNLPTNLITKHETTEISAVFAAFGALLTATAIDLSHKWRPLP